MSLRLRITGLKRVCVRGSQEMLHYFGIATNPLVTFVTIIRAF